MFADTSGAPYIPALQEAPDVSIHSGPVSSVQGTRDLRLCSASGEILYHKFHRTQTLWWRSRPSADLVCEEGKDSLARLGPAASLEVEGGGGVAEPPNGVHFPLPSSRVAPQDDDGTRPQQEDHLTLHTQPLLRVFSHGHWDLPLLYYKKRDEIALWIDDIVRFDQEELRSTSPLYSHGCRTQKANCFQMQFALVGCDCHVSKG